MSDRALTLCMVLACGSLCWFRHKPCSTAGLALDLTILGRVLRFLRYRRCSPLALSSPEAARGCGGRVQRQGFAGVFRAGVVPFWW